MRKKRWIVGVDWVDGSTEDTDEICVYAENEDAAKVAASAKFRMTIGAEWPHCKVQRVFVVTKKLIEEQCY